MESTLLPCCSKHSMSLPKPASPLIEIAAECDRLDRVINDAQAHQIELTKNAAQRRALDRGNRSIPQALGPGKPADRR
jgi:hypothetical protein